MNGTTNHTAGGYNWLDIWRQMYDAERAQAEARTADDFGRSGDHWERRAARFATATRRTPQPDPFMQVLLPHLRPDDTVLDVGAGSGRYIPVLARHTRHVIAVEPSPAMREHLEQRVAEEKLTNVEIVAATWPLDGSPQADVVLSAHVVYAVREIGPFLQAIHAAARRQCALFLMIRHRNAALSPLWQQFHGEPRLRLPAAIETINVLYQLGIAATLETVFAAASSYTNMNEAIHDIRQVLRFGPHHPSDTVLEAALEQFLVKHDDGSLSLPNQAGRAAVVQWEASDTLEI